MELGKVKVLCATLWYALLTLMTVRMLYAAAAIPGAFPSALVVTGCVALWTLVMPAFGREHPYATKAVAFLTITALFAAIVQLFWLSLIHQGEVSSFYRVITLFSLQELGRSMLDEHKTNTMLRHALGVLFMVMFIPASIYELSRATQGESPLHVLAGPAMALAFIVLLLPLLEWELIDLRSELRSFLFC